MRTEPFLSIRDLRAEVAGKEILKGLSLDLPEGEVHAVMGPNGSGKSTLAAVLTGREEFVVTGGSVTYRGRDLLEMPAEERAREGVFLSFQYPIAIPGITTAYFLKTAVNAVRKHRGEPELDAMDFLAAAKAKAKIVGMDESFLNRSLNEGFSGGEKKRNEIFQMLMLEPTLAVLDETDSGLDVDALRTVADGVNVLRAANRSMLVITHYQRLLNYIVPDRAHVLADGRIARSGGPELAHEVEEKGYKWIAEHAA